MNGKLSMRMLNSRRMGRGGKSTRKGVLRQPEKKKGRAEKLLHSSERSREDEVSQRRGFEKGSMAGEIEGKKI